ncbi:MAG: tyrosine-type recombinase/integrase [Deltaproteobacteria bacterium]|nr:tyrosine-type recombinase/integrase [Deltaproteobacteria bacterium]
MNYHQQRWAKSYSIVDHKLLHDGIFQKLSPFALSLYLFLVVVGDRCGKSFYSEIAIRSILKFSKETYDKGLRRLFRHRRRSSKIYRAHPHLFRHTFCSNLISQNVALPIVQKLMGHADINVTMTYIHMGIDDVSEKYHQAMKTLEKVYEC